MSGFKYSPNIFTYVWGIFYFAFIQSVLADYCESGKCQKDQYCCGENKCCRKTVDLWYFWAGILLIFIAIIVAIGLYFGKKKRHKYELYSPVPNQPDSLIFNS